MDTIRKYQISVCNEPEGRFVPYVGKKYEKGLKCETNNEIIRLKILAIGPRHYCDASKSDRNFFVMTQKQREKTARTNRYPDSQSMGCRKKNSKDCLKNNHESCPVYSQAVIGKCPLSKECEIKDQFLCNGNRNLRCETLLAIHDYLNSEQKSHPVSNRPRPEQNQGKTYFNQIASIIVNIYNPTRISNNIYDHIWKHIAFSNLIQRHISYQEYDTSQKINTQILKEDIDFIRKLIETLKPDVIIATMSCVKNRLESVLQNESDYSEWHSFDHFNLDFHVCCKPQVNNVFNKWDKILRECIERINPEWTKSQMKGYLKGIRDCFKGSHDISNSERPDKLPFLKSFQELLTKKADQWKSTNIKANNHIIENCATGGKYLYGKCGEKLRNWLKNSYGVDKDCYEQAIKDYKEIINTMRNNNI